MTLQHCLRLHAHALLSLCMCARSSEAPGVSWRVGVVPPKARNGLMIETMLGYRTAVLSRRTVQAGIMSVELVVSRGR